ncbi:DUF2071 domain-containing protein [Winogradskyella sp. PC D3.3]
MNKAEYQSRTAHRIQNRLTRSYIDVNTQLEHFAIISYKVPIEKIKHLIPKPFKLWTYTEHNQTYALVSAVPFKDHDFSFYRISRLPKFNFFQTNFRTYIIDPRDDGYSAWFFGTTLGSIAAMIPKLIWKMPWAYADYEFSFKMNNGYYSEYKMAFKSKFSNGTIDIKNTGNDVALLEGFKTMEEQIHILTHPITGYYNRANKGLGTYNIWHPKMDLKEGMAKNLYFELFEKLGLLNQLEMNNPHSVLITPKIEFDILLPPQKTKVQN